MIKLTEKNLKIVADIVLENIQDENGQGMFDAGVGVKQAVNTICEMIEKDTNAQYSLDIEQ